MADRSDGMMTGAFISRLRLRRIFKDLIAQPPLSLEDLYNQANNFIRAEEANNESRCREAKRGAPDSRSNSTYKDFHKKIKGQCLRRTQSTNARTSRTEVKPN
ncbi:hypothetical protein Tco_0158623 [Tanacetum coccineum]